MIAATGLAKRYDGTVALDDVDVRVEAGEVLAVTGPNGAGKTTLIRMLHLLDAPDRGEVRLDGRVVGPDDLAARRRMALVAQDVHLFRGTVRDNVALPLELRGRPADRVEKQVDQLLGRFALADLADRPTGSLSGGQSQRLAFARAVAPDPDVLFLDEFASNLDAVHLERLETAIRRRADDGAAVVLVTHDASRVRRLADRGLVLQAGRVARRGPVTTVVDALDAT